MMRLGEAMAEYHDTKATARWVTTIRLRRWERKARERAQSGGLDEKATIRLAAIRDELKARGEQLQPVRRGLP
jgi:hypothetical protein